jgi:hypothetical protein
MALRPYASQASALAATAHGALENAITDSASGPPQRNRNPDTDVSLIPGSKGLLRTILRLQRLGVHPCCKSNLGVSETVMRSEGTFHDPLSD